MREYILLTGRSKTPFRLSEDKSGKCRSPYRRGLPYISMYASLLREDLQEGFSIYTNHSPISCPFRCVL